jgi:dipeptidyl aminopeptidase/acylaminoacyl peptidase
MEGEHASDGERPADVSVSAFGWWPTAWSPEVVAAGKVSRSGLQADGDAVFWSESRPEDGGGQVVIRSSPAGAPPIDVSPPGVSVRSRVHEYGGAAATAHDGVLFYVDQADQQWYRVDLGSGTPSPTPLVPTPSGGAAPTDGPVASDPLVGAEGWTSRYADGRVTGSGGWLISVEERHRSGDTDHRLVAHPTGSVPRSTSGAGGSPGVGVVVLADEWDFVAAPRPSPDGRWLAWVSWDHPSMPWDNSTLWVAALDESAGSIRLRARRRVAGGEDSSVGQPRWGRDGSLYFVDDRTGWWLPYRLAGGNLGAPGAGPELLVDTEAEFHAPDWVLGQATMAERSDGSLVCRMHRDGRDQVVQLGPGGRQGGDAEGWSMEVVDQPCIAITGLTIVDGDGDGNAPATGDRLYVLGATATEGPAVWAVPWAGQGPAHRISMVPDPPPPVAQVSVARPFTASTPEGPVPGLFYAPVGAPIGADQGPPPLVVFCHGGPTSAAEGGLDPIVQFFTGRGLAVAAVNYRGSSGFGRAYRKRLDGRWGEADVDDCVGYAVDLAEAGLVDGRRMAIRGTSAGGLTALGALVRADRFAGAAAWYGVTDLEALAADTHDFESCYVDSLVGPWPEAADIYRSRSPLHRVDEIAGAVLLIQGRDDPVVPADQSERFAAMVEARGVPCRLVLFEGESHGFRRAATIEASLLAELAFYRSLFA